VSELLKWLLMAPLILFMLLLAVVLYAAWSLLLVLAFIAVFVIFPMLEWIHDNVW
jgi:hypothetical protein